MNRLQPQFYISFQVKQADYRMVLLDLNLYSNLKKNEDFIRFLEEKKNVGKLAVSTESLIFMKNDFLKKRKKKNKEITKLESLHLNAVRDVTPFEQFPKQNEEYLYLMTERFFWSTPTPNIGSARHALLLNMQIKGIGRTPIAIRHDHSHSWGGQYLWQAMKSYVVAKLLEGASPLGILRTPYVAVKNEIRTNPQVKSYEIALSIREADALRVTQVVADFEPGYKLTKKTVLTEMLNTLNVKNIKTHIKNVTFHYASLFLLGLRHMAVTRENVTLEGKLIDYEDIHIESDAVFFNFYVETKRCRKKKPKNFKRYEGDILYTSTVHLMLNAIIYTHIGFNNLDKNFKIDIDLIKRDFLGAIAKLSKEVFHVDKKLMSFIELLLKTNADYQSGQIVLMVPNLKLHPYAKSIVSRINDCSFTILKREHSEEEIVTKYNVQFPRVRFRNELIESYNLEAICSVSKMVDKCFLMLQLESFSGELDFEKMIDYSSMCNEQISKHSLFFPFRLQENKIVLKKMTLKEFKRSYQASIRNEFGANLEYFDQVHDVKSNQSIIRGAKIKLPSGKLHYLSIPPTLVTEVIL